MSSMSIWASRADSVSLNFSSSLEITMIEILIVLALRILKSFHGAASFRVSGVDALSQQAWNAGDSARERTIHEHRICGSGQDKTPLGISELELSDHMSARDSD